MSGSSVSPPPQARNKRDANGTAKIINLSFMLNPIPASGNLLSMNERKCLKVKTEMSE